MMKYRVLFPISIHDLGNKNGLLLQFVKISALQTIKCLTVFGSKYVASNTVMSKVVQLNAS